MKAIIVAAGIGQRLRPYTDDRPKCLVHLRGRPLLSRQLDAYRRAGVTEFVIVRGYRGEDLEKALAEEAGVRFLENPDYASTNILYSLMRAEAEMEGGFFFSYSDIVFRPAVVQGLLAATADISLVVDPFWEDAYHGRSDHPVSEAELCAVREGRVQAVGKRVVPKEQARGEFIGLLRVTAGGAQLLRDTYRKRLQELGLEAPYGRAPHLRMAYLTDLLNDLIAQGVSLQSVDIQQPSSWREIDTVQDLLRAEEVVDF